MFIFQSSPEPQTVTELKRRTVAMNFTGTSNDRTGHLLKCLAATKPGGRLLELGTATGLATAWLLDGMDAQSHLDTVDIDEATQNAAKEVLGADQRVTFHLTDGIAFLKAAAPESYDLIFADSWPGKFLDLPAALALVKPGGLYVIDDLLPQHNWPEGHQPSVDNLVNTLESAADLHTVRLDWSSGLMIATKRVP